MATQEMHHWQLQWLPCGSTAAVLEDMRLGGQLGGLQLHGCSFLLQAADGVPVPAGAGTFSLQLAGHEVLDDGHLQQSWPQQVVPVMKGKKVRTAAWPWLEVPQQGMAASSKVKVTGADHLSNTCQLAVQKAGLAGKKRHTLFSGTLSCLFLANVCSTTSGGSSAPASTCLNTSLMAAEQSPG